MISFFFFIIYLGPMVLMMIVSKKMLDVVTVIKVPKAFPAIGKPQRRLFLVWRSCSIY